MSKSTYPRAAMLERALKEQFFPDLETLLSDNMEGALGCIHDMDMPEYLVSALLERRTPVIALAVLRLLQMAPESLSIRLLNQTVDMTTICFQSSEAEEFFAKDCGRTLFDELKHFSKNNPEGSVREHLTRLLYRTLFQKAPESRHWIRDNFLSFDPMDMQTNGGLGRYDNRMLVILNYAGLDNGMIRERARQVLDVQLEKGMVDPQLIYLLNNQPEFDLEYLAKVAKHFSKSQNPSVSARNANRRILEKLGYALILNAQVDQVAVIRQCMDALLESGVSKLLDSKTGGDLLLDFVALAPGDERSRLQMLYARQVLTAAEVAPRLKNNRDLNFAIRASAGAFTLNDLLEHASETLLAARLESDLNL